MNKKIYDILPPKEEIKMIDKPAKNSGILAIKVAKDPIIKTKAVFASNANQEDIKPESIVEVMQEPSQDYISNEVENTELEKLPTIPAGTRKKLNFSFKM